MNTDDDKRLFEACLQINNIDHLKPFVLWVQQNRERCQERLETQSDYGLIRQIQGEAQAYKKVLELMESAQTALRKDKR